jgi:hypothetical protein
MSFRRPATALRHSAHPSRPIIPALPVRYGPTYTPPSAHTIMTRSKRGATPPSPPPSNPTANKFCIACGRLMREPLSLILIARHRNTSPRAYIPTAYTCTPPASSLYADSLQRRKRTRRPRLVNTVRRPVAHDPKIGDWGLCSASSPRRITS